MKFGKLARARRTARPIPVSYIPPHQTPTAPCLSAGLHGIVFHELLGFKETSGALIDRTAGGRAEAAARGGDRVRVSIAPHAPYSVSPELFRAVQSAVSASAEAARTSVHVGESPEEMELLASGTGEWARMRQWIGAWREDWVPPGTGPVEYLDELVVIDARTLVVHGVTLTKADNTEVPRPVAPAQRPDHEEQRQRHHRVPRQARY